MIDAQWIDVAASSNPPFDDEPVVNKGCGVQPPDERLTYEHASIHVDAPPETVYRLASDISRMGEWSPEAIGGSWLNDGTGQVGDWFEGNNRSGEREWSRECQVAVADPGREFTFVVGGVEENCTWWSYEMEPSGAGTTLTERWWIVNKTPGIAAATPEQFAGRVEMTKTMLATTIAGIKTTAESAAEAGATS